MEGESQGALEPVGCHGEAGLSGNSGRLNAGEQGIGEKQATELDVAAHIIPKIRFSYRYFLTHLWARRLALWPWSNAGPWSRRPVRILSMRLPLAAEAIGRQLMASVRH